MSSPNELPASRLALATASASWAFGVDDAHAAAAAAGGRFDEHGIADFAARPPRDSSSASTRSPAASARPPPASDVWRTACRPSARSPPGEGPIQRRPASITARAKSAFSDRKPYPGCIASAPAPRRASMMCVPGRSRRSCGRAARWRHRLRERTARRCRRRHTPRRWRRRAGGRGGEHPARDLAAVCDEDAPDVTPIHGGRLRHDVRAGLSHRNNGASLGGAAGLRRMAALHDHPTQMEKCLVELLASGRDVRGGELARGGGLRGDEVLEPVDLGVGDGLLVRIDEPENLVLVGLDGGDRERSSARRRPARRTP